MSTYKIKVVLLDEALAFIRSLPIKVQEKIAYNYKKIENGLISKELFKKLDDTEIWEFRTLYSGNCYRLFSFWDADTEIFIIATHGIVKKSQKTPKKEIEKAEKIREEYFKNK
ncbi:type II toxin-antitoxin system RelE/ParE family toxin [Parabacteroides distasonis]|nr:type II toxin-antitoxin system RelE/ParE family toxin [Parabacteroides distasonis]